MKSGCCYCPLHNDLPKQYLSSIRSRLSIRAFIAQNDAVHNCGHLASKQFEKYSLPFAEEVTLLIESNEQENKLYDYGLFAYCITTSGTTGEPKVVRVPHECIVPNITSIR